MDKQDHTAWQLRDGRIECECSLVFPDWDSWDTHWSNCGKSI